MSVTGLSEEPSRAAHFAVLEARHRQRFTVLDLDYRTMFWPSAEAATEVVQRALPYVSVAVGQPGGVRGGGGGDRPGARRRRPAGRRGRVGGREAGPEGCAGQDADRAGRVAADPGPDPQRARRRRRLRRLAVPRPAGGLAAGEDAAVGQRGRGDRRVAAGVLHRNARPSPRSRSCSTGSWCANDQRPVWERPRPSPLPSPTSTTSVCITRSGSPSCSAPASAGRWSESTAS